MYLSNYTEKNSKFKIITRKQFSFLYMVYVYVSLTSALLICADMYAEEGREFLFFKVKFRYLS